jgi:DNA-binding NarL/FixJ family response regulator
MSIKVSLVEDNTSIRQSLAQIIVASAGFRLGDACATGEEALRTLPSNPPDVVLMDINLPRLDGIQCVGELKRCLPRTQFVMLTIEDDSQRVFDSLKAGASGYLVKNVPPEKILEAVAEVHAGGSPMSSHIARMVVQTFQIASAAVAPEVELSPREKQIVTLLGKGYRSKEIAEELSISSQTVNTHVRNIYEKLHVRSRAEAVAKFLLRER